MARFSLSIGRYGLNANEYRLYKARFGLNEGKYRLWMALDRR